VAGRDGRQVLRRYRGGRRQGLPRTNNEDARDPKIKGPKAVLACFNEADGKFLWQAVHDMPRPPVDQQAQNDGQCSAPTVEGDRLYYLTPAAEIVCAGTQTARPSGSST